ncbi:pectate lyase family protein [Paractinoplanes toevensis]|uniref:Pectate lyase domain-containing protein n=1 Tax=Paractinoplanes toevensis TaxID=571911 RepID=A0A919TJA4_9ACTN|nr:polysaccharide lyase family 1 protein [Actinoplanes toevensis]GIM95515.1 hypothetical protein Ato02nite_073080 [Actinoplanes toevensis]
MSTHASLHSWRIPLLATATLAATAVAFLVSVPAASAATFNQEGWSTQGGGTSGGSTSTTVTVTSLSALTTAAKSSTSQTITVNGNFSCSADVTVAANKTIVGVGSSSGLTGCGFKINDVNNVIIRNLKIAKVRPEPATATPSTSTVPPTSGSTTSTCPATPPAAPTITTAWSTSRTPADYITVSWNYEHDHIKCNLLGHSDDNAAEDTGHLRVTYHHNYFRNCDQRGPRVRFGNPVHVYNNYYYNSGTYGVATTCNAGVYVERNYFENTPNTVVTSTGSSPAGTGKI